MKDFSRESELLGEDFCKVLKEAGGKNAGNRLINAIYDRNRFKLFWIAKKAGLTEIISNECFEIPTCFYKDFENILTKKEYDCFEEFRKENDDYVDNFEIFFKEKINRLFPEKKRKQKIHKLKDGTTFVIYDENEVLLRSSSTSEDFIRSDLAGTSLSIPYSVDDSNMRIFYYLFHDFLKKKKDDKYGYSDCEALGIQVAKLIGGENYLRIIGTCENYDDGELINIEAKKPNGNVIRYVLQEGRLETYFPLCSEDLLSEAQVRSIAELLRLKREILGCNIDSEYILSEETLYDLQLRRLAPILDDRKKIKIDKYSLFTSPFTLRKMFDEKGLLLIPDECSNVDEAYLSLQNIHSEERKDYFLLLNGYSAKVYQHLLKDFIERPFKAVIFSRGNVDLTHSSEEGFTYFLKNSDAKIVSIPGIKDSLDIKLKESGYEHILRSKRKIRVKSDGRFAQVKF